MNHGTTTAYKQGCRCDDCRRAASRYRKMYRYRAGEEKRDGVLHYPRPQTAPIDRVVAHLAALTASGWRMTDIAAEAEVGRNYLWNIRAGKLIKRVRLDTEARILAVQPLEPVDVDDVAVDRFIADGGDWHTLTRAERVEAARRMDAAGVSRARIQERTGLRSSVLYGEVYGQAAS